MSSNAFFSCLFATIRDACIASRLSRSGLSPSQGSGEQLELRFSRRRRLGRNVQVKFGRAEEEGRGSRRAQVSQLSVFVLRTCRHRLCWESDRRTKGAKDVLPLCSSYIGRAPCRDVNGQICSGAVRWPLLFQRDQGPSAHLLRPFLNKL